MESIVQAAAAGEAIEALLDEYRRKTGASFSEASDRLMVTVAERFLEGRMSYADADEAANVWWGLMSRLAHPEVQPIPHLASAIFEAFDAGEYIRRDDDLDPVERYTVPMLRSALDQSTTAQDG